MIVSSSITEDSRQADGRRWIAEQHIDQLGLIYAVRYLVDALFDVAAALAARVTALNASLVSAEIASNISRITTLGSLATVTLSYSTAAQSVAALRIAYAVSSQTQAVFIGDFLSSLTDAQLQTAFGLTQGQVTTLRTNKLTPAATQASALRAAVGA